MRFVVPCALLAVLLTAVTLPSAPAHATSAPLSSLSSPAPDTRVLVDIPGFGVYVLHEDVVGRGLRPEAASPEDLLSAAVFSADHEGDMVVRDAALTALAALAPAHHTQVTHALAALHSPIATPDSLAADTPVVVLGERLNEDGSLRPNLRNRLRAALAVAQERPEATVVVTGGPTRPGGTEAHAMRDWLLANGLTNPLLVEDRSRSTVDNARHTRDLLPTAEAVIIVTSKNHLPRAVVDFTLAFGPHVAGVGAPDEPPTGMPGLLWTYRDAVHWFLG